MKYVQRIINLNQLENYCRWQLPQKVRIEWTNFIKSRGCWDHTRSI